jgi:hypothetical protein
MSDTDILNWILTPIGSITLSIITLILIATIAFAYSLLDASEEMLNECKTIFKNK